MGIDGQHRFAQASHQQLERPQKVLLIFAPVRLEPGFVIVGFKASQEAKGFG